MEGACSRLMHTLKMITSLLTRREKIQILFILFAIIIMGFIELAGVGSIGPFISLVQDVTIITNNQILYKIYTYFNFTSSNDFVIFFGIGIIILICASNLYLIFINSLITMFSAKRFYSLSMRIMKKYFSQPYIYFLNINTSEIAKKILNDTQTYIKVLNTTLQLISSIIISVSILLLLLILNPVMAILVGGIFGVLYAIILLFIRKFINKKGREKQAQDTLRYKYINESFHGIKDIKILHKENAFMNYYSTAINRYAKIDAIIDIINEIPKYFIEMVAFGGIIGIIAYLIRAGYNLSSFLPLLSVYAFGTYRLLPSLQKIFRGITNIKFNIPVISELNTIYKKLDDFSIGKDNEISNLPFTDSIKLDNIIFRYPVNNQATIKNISLVIPVNSSVAFVGATGSGKTTLVDIILGLLEPQEGKLLVDDIPITKENIKNWQKNIGYVPQNIYLTDDTINNNIAFGVKKDDIDTGRVIKAAKIANIHEFIVNELEKGYDAIIGERGIRLSGGQRQRIGIARALYHDPEVIIFDEATSALDSLTENAVMDAINKLAHKKTIIIIAHRITTVKNCDILYLVEKGSILDRGSYDELYTKSQVFRKMAGGYKQ
jgi:ABC-type multidrug transport system fused ATPase/permease subunit